MRVPTPNVSLVELVFCSKKDLSIAKLTLYLKILLKNKTKKFLK